MDVKSRSYRIKQSSLARQNHAIQQQQSPCPENLLKKEPQDEDQTPEALNTSLIDISFSNVVPPQGSNNMEGLMSTSVNANNSDVIAPEIKTETSDVPQSPNVDSSAVEANNSETPLGDQASDNPLNDNDTDTNSAGVHANKCRQKKRGENWVRTLKKNRRAQGLEYLGRVYNSSIDKLSYRYVNKEARHLGERCGCKPENNTCRTIKDEERQRIFQSVWEMSWEEKKIFVMAMTDRMAIKRRKVGVDESKKSAMFQYHVKVDGERKKVCMRFFLATTGLKETWVRDQLKKHLDAVSVISVNENKRQKGKEISNTKLKLVEFLNTLPKMESHYCRKTSSKLYLEPLFSSISAVYQQYKISSGDDFLSRFVFEEQFHLMNLSIFQPRKDQCDLCVSHQEGNVDDTPYYKHREKTERAQKEKETDKAAANEHHSRTKVITVDMQSVLLCPMLKASALYYRTKLCVHNYTIFDVSSEEVCCYVWNESEGGLSANEYASCLLDYLSDFLNDYDSIIIYLDGCKAQHRNVTLSSALSYFSMTNNVTIYPKKLEIGHGQMEVDSVHSCIERQIKNKRIQIPGDYVHHIEAARKLPKPYHVKHLKFDFFKDFTDVKSFTSIRPGTSLGDPTVTDSSCLSYIYKPSGQIQYKLQYDDQWRDLPMWKNDSVNIFNEPKPLHQSRLKISESKFKDLQELKSVIHADYHHYYDSLPH